MEIVSSGNRALTGLPEPAMAWIEAPESADAAFVLDGTWHMVGDDPVPVDSTTILMLSATTPATRGTGFDITLHVGSYSAIWHIRTMSEDGIIFTSIPTAFAYQGQPYTYPIATYSANMEAIPVISLLETADWLTLAWEADSFTATLSGITPGSMAVFEPGDTPAFATTGGTSSTYGSHYSYDLEATTDSSVGAWMEYVSGPAWLRLRHLGSTNVGAYKPFGNVVADAGGARVAQPTDLLTLSGVPPWPENFIAAPEAGDPPDITTSGGTSTHYGSHYSYDLEATTDSSVGAWMEYVSGPTWLRLRHLGSTNVAAYKPFGNVIADAGGARVAQPTDLLTLSGVPPWPENFIAAPEAGDPPDITTSGGTSTTYGSHYSYDFEATTHDSLSLWMEYVSGPAWLRLRNLGSTNVGAYKPFGNVIADVGDPSVTQPTDLLSLSGIPPWPAPMPDTSNATPAFVAPTPSQGSTVATTPDFLIDIAAEDADPVDSLLLETISSLPAGMSFTYNGNATRTASIEGTGVANGSYSITLTARDARSASASRSFTIQVSN